ncbi:MAG: hypothetical protein V3T58_05010 [Candidatus Hydrothermarchaeales archaeon]
MDVVKVGGSLMDIARDVMEELKGWDALIVPGGGIFADVVRDVYKEHVLSEGTAHSMAIAAMDQYGRFLADISGVKTTDSLSDVATPCVFLPYHVYSKSSALEPSWDVTSDTIGCHVAKEVGADRFIILTDVNGVYIDGRLVPVISAQELSTLGTTCIDSALPRYLKEYCIDCLVVNGKDFKGIRSGRRENYEKKPGDIESGSRNGIGTLILGR